MTKTKYSLYKINAKTKSLLEIGEVIYDSDYYKYELYQLEAFIYKPYKSKTKNEINFTKINEYLSGVYFLDNINRPIKIDIFYHQFMEVMGNISEEELVVGFTKEYGGDIIYYDQYIQ